MGVAFLLTVWDIAFPKKYPLYAYSKIKSGTDAAAFVYAQKSEFERAPEMDIKELPNYYAVRYEGKFLYLHIKDA